MSLCAVRIAAGSTASAAAAPSPAVRPNTRRTRSYSSGTARIAAITSGSRTVTRLKPNSLTAATCSQRSAGALSTETCPAGSIAPKKKSCHEMAHAAHGGVVERVRLDTVERPQPQHGADAR